MKRIILSGLTALLLFSCTKHTNSYSITGKASDELEGKKVYLKEVNAKELTTVDSVVIENGVFSFEGVQDSARNYMLVAESTDQYQVPNQYFILQNGSYNVVLDSICSVNGPELSDKFRAYLEANQQLKDKQTELQKEKSALSADNQLSDEKETEINKQIEELRAESSKLSLAFIEANKNNVAGAIVFYWSFRNFDRSQQEEIIQSASKEFQSYAGVVYVTNLLDVLTNTAEGKQYTDFSMPSIKGDTISLSDIVPDNKLTLVDFWATWCAPCRAEIPNIKEIYRDYKSKGLEIVGVSLDKEDTRWKNYVNENELNWVHMSELKHWNSAAGRIYGINSIPHVILIDQKGTIVSRGLHGKALREKIAEILD
ncbi:MAG: thioredoxin-like domain-containing protein [Bacteroidales bacterium]